MSLRREGIVDPATWAPASMALLGLGGIVALGGSASAWAFAGWAVAAVSGLVVGAWVARGHGGPARDFLLRFSASMLARFAAYALGLLGAFRLQGSEAVLPYLLGLLLGYLPVQAHEMIGFARRSGGR